MTVIIGIDPGVNTGLAVWDVQLRVFMGLYTLQIFEAMERVRQLHGAGMVREVRFEDCRLRKWKGARGREALRGVGSVERDCSIWSEYLAHIRVPFKAIEPKTIRTKLSKSDFERLTGYSARTSEHARDAAMQVFGSF